MTGLRHNFSTISHQSAANSTALGGTKAKKPGKTQWLYLLKPSELVLTGVWSVGMLEQEIVIASCDAVSGRPSGMCLRNEPDSGMLKTMQPRQAAASHLWYGSLHCNALHVWVMLPLAIWACASVASALAMDAATAAAGPEEIVMNAPRSLSGHAPCQTTLAWDTPHGEQQAAHAAHLDCLEHVVQVSHFLPVSSLPYFIHSSGSHFKACSPLLAPMEQGSGQLPQMNPSCPLIDNVTASIIAFTSG